MLYSSEAEYTPKPALLTSMRSGPVAPSSRRRALFFFRSLLGIPQ